MEQPPIERRRRTNKIILSIFGAIFGFLLLLILLIAVLPESEAPKQTTSPPSPPPAETLSSITALPPSPLPSVSCPTPAEQMYFDALDVKMRRIGALAEIMQDDMVRAADNPVLLYDELWLMGRTNNIYVFNQDAANILALDSPESSVGVSRAATQMAQRIQTSMADMETEVENHDEASFTRAILTMNLAAGDAKHVRGLRNYLKLFRLH